MKKTLSILLIFALVCCLFAGCGKSSDNGETIGKNESSVTEPSDTSSDPVDVDFSQATLDGLRYFWPRLEKGGYLMLHDWGSPKLSGVAKALADFEKEKELRIPVVPLCDVGGSLVLCK